MANGVSTLITREPGKGRGRPKKRGMVNGNGLNKTMNGKSKFETIGFNPHFVPLDAGTELDGIRKDVFIDRYSLKGVDGKAMEKYPEQLWRRVAWGLAQVEKTAAKKREWEEKFYDVMENFKFVPAGRILSGAGTGYEVTFYNCYVIPSPSDSRGGIMDNITKTVEIQSRSGGVGINLSTLRPRGARVKKVNGWSSGPVNWANLYSTANHDVIQQGGSRRGALMLMLNDWHPDVEEFITVKEDLTKIPGANLSVCLSDAFMQAVKDDGDWELMFPDLDDPEYDEKWKGDIEAWREMGKQVKVFKTVKARQVWKRIAEAAWRSAEPGLMFIDRYNKMSNTWYFEKIIATNPCGEQGLGEWGVCNLGALNLVAYAENGQFELERLKKDVKVAIRMLDNVIDANYYFYAENEKAQMGIRRTGLGTMGLGDALIKLGIRYGSEEALKKIEEIYAAIRDAAYEASADLSAEKGSFGNWDKEKYLQGKFVRQLPVAIQEKIADQGIRNAVLLTQAPTGTTSILAGVSSGIEPVYEFAFKRKDRTGEHVVYHELYQKWLEEHPGDQAPDYFVSAKELSPEEHVRVQAMVQKYTDSSISKTVNAPETHTIEDVERLYTSAYELGCKGIAYFRDGSRKGVLSSLEEKKEEPPKVAEPLIKPRPVRVEGATYKINTPLGHAFITVNNDVDGNPFEVFVTIGKAGSEVAAMAEALGRLISSTMRFGNHLPAKERALELVSQLRGIGGSKSVGFGPERVRSLPDAVGKAIAMHFGLLGYEGGVQAGNGAATTAVQQELLGGNHELGIMNHGTGEGQISEAAQMPLVPRGTMDLCPECKEPSFAFEEGCKKCYSCGYSEC